MVAGPESLSGQECAQIWSEALDRPVKYVGDDDSVWEPIFRLRLQGKKLEDLRNSFRFLQRRSVVLPKAVAATTRLLGRPPRSYREYVGDQMAGMPGNGVQETRVTRTSTDIDSPGRVR